MIPFKRELHMKTPIEAKPVILLRFSQNLDT